MEWSGERIERRREESMGGRRRNLKEGKGEGTRQPTSTLDDSVAVLPGGIFRSHYWLEMAKFASCWLETKLFGGNNCSASPFWKLCFGLVPYLRSIQARFALCFHDLATLLCRHPTLSANGDSGWGESFVNIFFSA